MNEPQEPSSQEPDLGKLTNLDFGPSWVSGGSESKFPRRFSDQKQRGKQPTDKFKRDRRGSLKSGSQKNDIGGKQGFGNRKDSNRERSRGQNKPRRDSFQPTVRVDIYPKDEAFDALVKRLRSTVRTYQLFEIAHLILEKPDRYVVAVQNKAKKDEKPSPLYYSVPDYFPFETEEAAINHFLKTHLESLFDIEAVEVETPKGNFQVVNRCTITGELLGPPNYHRYQEFLQSHYASRIISMPFDQYVSKVESVKDQEVIDQWVESMKKGFKYTLKEPNADDPESFESLEAVRTFLIRSRKDAVVGSGGTVRFAGTSIKDLPKSALRTSVENYIENQIQFPLDTANNIRGRLRRHHFTVYKKGSKGVSYVCAVKRKFRDSKTVFTPSIQQVIEFIEKNPNIPVSQLVKQHLGIDTENQKPEKLAMTDAEVVEAKAVATEKASGEVDNARSEQTDDSTETASATVVETTPVKTPKSSTDLNEEDSKKLNQLLFDLRWLVSEGYVTEYGDGRLFASPQMPDAKPKDTLESNEQKVTVSEESSVDSDSVVVLDD